MARLTAFNKASISLIVSQLLFLIATGFILFSDIEKIELIAFGVASLLFGITILTIFIENKVRGNK